jgi:hypothetical protein
VAKAENVVKPAKLSKTPNPIKTIEIKVENNWRTSFGQFGKIELEMKKSRPGPAEPNSFEMKNLKTMSLWFNTLRWLEIEVRT